MGAVYTSLTCRVFGHRWLLGVLKEMPSGRNILTAKYCQRCGAVEWIG